MMARQVRTTRTFYTDDSQIFLELTTDRSWADLELTRLANGSAGAVSIGCGAAAAQSRQVRVPAPTNSQEVIADKPHYVKLLTGSRSPPSIRQARP